MAVAFRGSTSIAITNTTTTASIAKPAGTVDGDALVVVFLTSDTVVTPSGWALTLSGTLGTGGAVNFLVFTRSASSEPASWAFTVAGPPLARRWECPFRVQPCRS